MIHVDFDVAALLDPEGLEGLSKLAAVGQKLGLTLCRITLTKPGDAPAQKASEIVSDGMEKVKQIETIIASAKTSNPQAADMLLKQLKISKTGKTFVVPWAEKTFPQQSLTCEEIGARLKLHRKDVAAYFRTLGRWLKDHPEVKQSDIFTWTNDTLPVQYSVAKGLKERLAKL